MVDKLEKCKQVGELVHSLIGMLRIGYQGESQNQMELSILRKTLKYLILMCQSTNRLKKNQNLMEHG
jgi:hypothetical protein